MRERTTRQRGLVERGIAKNAREEKIRARDEKLRQQQENEKMMKLYREVVLKETPGEPLVQIQPAIAAAPPKPQSQPDQELVGSCGD